MAKKISYNDIQNIHEDWTLDERNGFPYSGQSVQNFIKKTLNEKGGEFYHDSVTNKYLIFADAESRDTYLADREHHTDLIIGSFDAPANYTASIHMTTPSSNVVLSGTKGCYIDFTFDIVDKEGRPTSESIVATYTFNNAGNTKKITQIYAAGENVHFLVDDYLGNGSNTVNVTISGRNTLAGAMAVVTYTVVALEFTSDFNFAKSIVSGEFISVPYYLEGAGVKYIEWYIDGVKMQAVDTISDLRVRRTKNIPTTGIATGKHNVQARAYITNGGDNFYSKTLYFDIVIIPSDESLIVNTTFVLLGLILDEPTQSTLSVSVEQYFNFDYKAAVYDSRNRSLEMVVSDNGTQVQSIAMYAEEVQSLSYASSAVGSHTLTFTAEASTAEMSVNVTEGDIEIQEATEDLALKLTAKGRSNSESNPAVWSYGNINTTFRNFTSWNNQSGWVNNALVIPVGASIEVGLNPLGSNPITTGKTIEIEYEAVNVADENAQIMSIVNQENNAGLTITASTAKLRSRGGASVDTKYRDGDKVHLTFIINKTTGDDPRMMYIVNNGILERAAQFGASDSFSAPGNIIIGSSGCIVKLYSIRVYNRALSVDEAFCNYAVDSPDLIKIASNNDIYDSDSGGISVDKVNANIPVMIITGDISYILSINDKAHKNDWNTYPVQIEFRDMQNPERNFFIDDADIRLQGTSSISYPRKNFRIYSISKSEKYQTKLYSPTHNAGDLVKSGKYSFKPKAAAVSCWCLKADYAESSGSHNTGIAKFWNKRMYDTIMQDGSHPLRTAAQAWAVAHSYPYDVRTTIDGFPIVLFQRDNENAALTCLGQYNFNNDKSTEDVFGFTALEVKDSQGHVERFDNSHVECWEVLDSDNSIALFTDVTDFNTKWSDAFEARYPGKNKNVVALRRVSNWINSCYLGMDGETMRLDMEKWRAERAQYFDLPKLAAYYIYLLRFGAVDQTVKNAMFTTEDGEHWFYINYDNDTVLGIDNASHLFDTWDYGLKTKTPQGGWYYAGKGMSVLWNLFEADNVDDDNTNYKSCVTLAKEIDELLFGAGMNYETICEMFDNEQSSKWCERIYNENGYYKYIEQAKLGQNVLYMLQGSRKSHRHWWLQHRLEKYDNEFGNGTYTRRSIQARAEGSVLIPQGSTYKFVPAVNSKFGYAVASTIVEHPTARVAGTEYTSAGLPQATGVGNFIYIYNANNIRDLDVSGYIAGLAVLDVSAALDINGGSWLRKLVLGDGTHENVYLTAISGLAVIKDLEELDVRGYKAITKIDALVSLPNLHKLNAANSGLTEFTMASGAVLTQAILPNTIQSIVLNSVDITAITYEPTSVLRKVELVDIKGSWDAKTFVNTWLALLTDAQLEDTELTLGGIDWTDMTTAQVIRIGSVGIKNLRGKVTLTSITEQDYNDIVAVFGEDVFSPNSQFVIDAPGGAFISGPSQIVSGGQARYSATSFPVTEDAPQFYLYNTSETLISDSGTDERGFYYYYSNLKLYRDTGLVITTGNVSDYTVKIRARFVSLAVWSEYLSLDVKALRLPTVTIGGVGKIRNVGQYNFPVNLGTYNAELQRIEYTIDVPASVAVSSWDSVNNRVVLNVLAVQGDATYTLRVSAVCRQGTTYADKSINITDSDVIMDSNSNPEVLAVCYQKGWCSRSDRMTMQEAAAVVDIGTAFKNKNIKHFEELQYFTSLVTLSDEAFAYNNQMTNIEIPDGVTKIGEQAFIGCPKLSYVKIPGTVTKMGTNYGYIFDSCLLLKTAGPIGGGYNIEFGWTTSIPDYAFYSRRSGYDSQSPGSNYIESIIIPDGITSIGQNSFGNCTRLNYIRISSSVTNVYYPFTRCLLLKTAGPIGGGYNIEFGWTTSIPDYAFSQCTSLQSITLPDGVTSIGIAAFQGCNKITSIEIPNTLTTISERCLEGCYGLTSITIPNLVTSIGERAFFGCSGLSQALIIPDSVTNIGCQAFQGCIGITSVVFPSGLTAIKESLFTECKGLTSITIPNSVTSIGYEAFKDCSGLTSITIPESVTTIGDGVISGCYGLTSITVAQGNTKYDSRDNCNAIIETANNKLIGACVNTVIPDGITSIGGSVFMHLPITSIVIPNSVTSIGIQAFMYCESLASVTLSSNITTIPMGCFRYCSALKSIIIPSSVTTVVQQAFFGSGLESIEIPANVTSLGSQAFYQCKSLLSATISASVVIPYQCFYCCENLTTVVLSNSVKNIEEGAFESCKKLKTITLPNNANSRMIGVQVFYGCSELESVIIGSYITEIARAVFTGCVKLSSITCLSALAPSVQSNTFGENSSTYAGKDVQGTKTLYVPSGATGYDASYWASVLLDSSKCNFTLSATL